MNDGSPCVLGTCVHKSEDICFRGCPYGVVKLDPVRAEPSLVYDGIPPTALSLAHATEIMEHAFPVICVDIPRSAYCYTLEQATAFFEQTEPPPHAAGVSSWVPTVDRVELALLGKLLEETTELGKIAARCIIQGLDGHDPETLMQNSVVLAAELSDMEARILDVRQVLDLPWLTERTVKKSKFHLAWLCDLKRRFGSRLTPPVPRQDA
jgi:hypothetical protein